jgi:cell division transport system permease protein
MARRARPRSVRFDDLGLRRALGDRVLPLLVAAMAFLAALALAGAIGTAALARHWQQGAAAALTVQVPQPDGPADGLADRLEKVVQILLATPGVASARPLAPAELEELLRPWLGAGVARLSLPLPAVIEVHLLGAGPDLTTLDARLQQAVPGTLTESHGQWVERLTALARSVQACAWLALALVAAVAAAVIAIGTRAGLAARRDAIEIVHGLGATDRYIAVRFARRVTVLAASGGILGALAALPVLLALARLTAPFVQGVAPLPELQALPPWAGWIAALPRALWISLPALPAAAAVIGYLTAQGTVRHWLRQLP